MNILVISNMVHSTSGGSEKYNSLLYTLFPKVTFFEVPFAYFESTRITQHSNVILMNELCNLSIKQKDIFTNLNKYNFLIKRFINFLNKKWLSFKAKKIITKVIKDKKIDKIIISSSYFQNKKFMKIYKNKIIFIQHQNPYVYLNFWYFDDLITKKYKKFALGNLIFEDGSKYYLKFNFLKYSNNIVCFDESNKIIINNLYNNNIYPITPPSRLGIIEYKNKKKEYDFIFPARIVDSKNPYDLVAFCKKYNNYKLLICGDGDKINLFKNILNVDVIGNITDDEQLINLYKKSKFLISFSFSEGYPFIVLEALSLGIPCIVSNSFIGAKYLLGKNSERGFIFDLNDPDKFEKINQFIQECDYEILSNNAIEFAKDNLTIDNFYNNWKKLLEKN